MALELVSEEFDLERPEPKPVDVRILNVISALMPVLAVRLMLFVAIVGSGVLTYSVLPVPNTAALWALGIYNVFVTVPLTWLASKRA